LPLIAGGLEGSAQFAETRASGTGPAMAAAPVVDRRKQGFGIPLDRWAGPRMSHFLRDLLCGSDARSSVVLQRDEVVALLAAFAGGSGSLHLSRIRCISGSLFSLPSNYGCGNGRRHWRKVDERSVYMVTSGSPNAGETSISPSFSARPQRCAKPGGKWCLVCSATGPRYVA